MCNSVRVSDYIKDGDKYVRLPFFMNGKPFDSVCAKSSGFKDDVHYWGMTLRAAGSMRFRWNETNPNRDAVLSLIAKNKRIVPVELIHSKIVFDLNTGLETQSLVGDGLVTASHKLLPTVTVADCVPIYFFDPKSGALGIVHSGWKGTGIIALALQRAQKKYGLNLSTTMAAIGPHIGNCCYFVDQKRADYFKENFGSDCVEVVQGKNMLSLTRANLTVLQRAGVKVCNTVVAEDCTACNAVFGSFRREAAFLSEGIDKMRAFTVQAAFVD